MMGLQYHVVYKKGIHNGAADSLSRRPFDVDQVFPVTEVQPAWLDQVTKS